MKKRMTEILITAVLTTGLLAGCGSNPKTETAPGPVLTTAEAATEPNAETTEAQSGETTEAEGSYTIGISQFAEHGSLDNCRLGFLEGLAEAGIEEGVNLTVIYDNAQSDMATASTIADNYVFQNVDMICAIATPSAMTAFNSCMDTEIPVIYTAISDPVAAELADDTGASTGNITGTSDALPVTEQLSMIREMMPEAKRIGILYSTSEANSESTIALYKAHAEEYGFEIVDSAITTGADIPMAAAALAGKVDCINNLTDNTVVSALQTVIEAATAENIPVFGSEIEQVKNGCVAAVGLDYVQLGKQTGAMAAKVLKGEARAQDIPFEVISESSLYINTAAAQNIELTIDETVLAKAAEVFETIE